MKTTRTWHTTMNGVFAYLLCIAFLSGVLAGVPLHAHAAELSKTSPVTVTADKLDYDRVADVYTATGNVKIEHSGVRLEADKVVLNNKTGEALAEGHVLLQDKGDMTRADKLQINMNTRAGIMYKGNIFLNKQNLHVKGDVIERRSETTYHVEQGVMTTCDEDQWYIKANELDVDLNRYATAKGVSFNLMGLPMLYTPYFFFPVKRQTGFLLPEAGQSSVDGIHVTNSFFWAISDYKDMTLVSDYREKTGHGTGLEYRYNNSAESAGRMYGKFWNLFQRREVRDERYLHPTRESRWELRLRHQEEFAEDLSGRVDINLVSDEHYYHDMDKKLEMKAMPYLDSNAFYVERWNTASLYLLGQYTTDLVRSNDATIQKLPELRYTMYQEPLFGPLHLSLDGSAVNFIKEHGDGARRVDLSPQLSAPFGSNGLSLTPRAGVRGTFYDRSGPDAAKNNPTSRTYAFAGMDLNARVSRVYGKDEEEGIGRMRHSIEPTVSYSYISHFGKADLPQFDAVDSVVSMNTVTVSLINRITARYKESKTAQNTTTFDLMVLKLSQGYNLSAMDAAGHRSPVQGDLQLQAPNFFSIMANGSYDVDAHRLSSRSVIAGFTTSLLQMNLSYQWARDSATPSEYIGVGGVLKLGSWELGAQKALDLQTRLATQEEYKVHYGSQCWGVSVVYTHTPGESRITGLLDLKGLGSVGKK